MMPGHKQGKNQPLPHSEHGGKPLARAVERAYQAGQTDYSMEPLVHVDAADRPIGLIQRGDTVIFCCRRGEREIELTEAFTDPDFPHFKRDRIQDLDFVILTLYHEKFKDLAVAFAPSMLRCTLGEVVSQVGLTQFHCAESEKYAHVTFFLNGGNHQAFPGEVDKKIPSPKGIPFDEVPELSLPEVSREVVKAIDSGFNLIVTNFANGDVIGHTANHQAKIHCAEVIDTHLQTVIHQALSADYAVLVTADHGNLEEMITAEGNPHVAHTSNLVPFIAIDPRRSDPLPLSNGRLGDIAPTVLNILGITHPAEMTGHDLVADHTWGSRRKVLLIILDGWGIGKDDQTNPIHLANTPFWDSMLRKYTHSALNASGEDVGLRQGKAGNSEAGHTNIGAGRIVLQDDVRLEIAMRDGSFFSNRVFHESIAGAIERKRALHLIGLLTEKSSHGSIEYPLALLKIAKEKGLNEIYLHLIFDGRSTEPGSAPHLLVKLESAMAEIGAGQIVSGVGRGIALDRDGNYPKIKRAYEAMVQGRGERYN